MFFSVTFLKFHLEKHEGNNVLMSKVEYSIVFMFVCLFLHNVRKCVIFSQVFGVLLTFLQVGQSEMMQKHVFASLRSFIHKVRMFPVIYFYCSLCMNLRVVTFHYFVFSSFNQM